MPRMEVIPHRWWDRRSFFVACLPNAAHLSLMQPAGLSAGAPQLEGVLNRFGGAGQKCAANPGLTPSFRRSLPETGCLSQGLPRGICCPFVVPPKRLSTRALGRLDAGSPMRDNTKDLEDSQNECGLSFRLGR